MCTAHPNMCEPVLALSGVLATTFAAVLFMFGCCTLAVLSTAIAVVLTAFSVSVLTGFGAEVLTPVFGGVVLADAVVFPLGPAITFFGVLAALELELFVCFLPADSTTASDSSTLIVDSP